MARAARRILGGLAAIAALGLLVSVVVSRPLFDDALDPASLAGIAIAPPDRALSFARIRQGDRLAVLLVSRYEHGEVTGADLTAALGAGGADPIALYRQHGYDALRAAARNAPALTVRADALDVPFETHERNIGVGLNYAEHAEESGLDEPPFLFPKYALPTPPGSGISRSDSLLLDYEAEPAGTVIFSGTPAGVIFKPLNLWNPWVYLLPGDEVVVRADFLGVIRNRISE